MKSIIRRLLVPLLFLLTTAAVLATFSTYLKAYEELNEFFDYQITQMALSLRDQKDFLQRPKSVSEFERDDGVNVQIWEPAGNLIYQSRGEVHLPRVTDVGLHTVYFQKDKWRVFLLVDKEKTVQVAQSLKGRREASFDFASGTIIPILIIFCIVTILITLVIRYVMKPLTELANSVAKLSPNALESINESNLPAEIVPLVQRLNLLFGQLAHAFDVQRLFVANAAHELRTPLTALKLQVRIMERSFSEEEKINALKNIKLGVERAARLVTQLLMLARIEPEALHAPMRDVSLNTLIGTVINEQARIAFDKEIALHFSENEPVSVKGDSDAIRSIISNLLDNAIRYTPHGGAVELVLIKNEENAIIKVVDNGPGIPIKERELVFDRFYRGQRVDSLGCGLGLSIVKSAVMLHGGTILLGDGYGQKGVSVVIELPLHLGTCQT